MFTTALLANQESRPTDRTASTSAGLALWEHPSRHSSAVGLLERPPSIVLHPRQADLGTGIICLAALGYAYRACAAAFLPGDDWTSVTLLETRDLNHPGLELISAGTINLFTIGWASRSGAVRFTRH